MSNKARKHAQREAVMGRLGEALEHLHHNARVNYPDVQNEYEDMLFTSWFEQVVPDEIEYIESGGAYGNVWDLGNHVYTRAIADGRSGALAHRLRSAIYREAAYERERCNDLDTHGRVDGYRFSWREGLVPNTRESYHGSRYVITNALWEYISNYGKLYQYGRSGATLAPEKLMGRGMRDNWPLALDDVTAIEDHYENRVELLRILESFNRYVTAWCDSVPEMWADQKAEDELQPAIDAHDGMRPVQHTITEWRAS